MLIKSSDDKQPDLDVLRELLNRRAPDQATRGRIEREIRAIRAGAKGERDAAYEIEFQYGASQNVATMHDLRLECDGRVAQIDHLLITRLMEIWVCESKSFAEGVAINEHGEWSSYHQGKPRAVPSPIEQNRRHIAVLNDVFRKRLVKVPTRLGLPLQPRVRGLVLVANHARISRPKVKPGTEVAGLDTVIKCEQLEATISRANLERGVLDAARLISSETLERFARDLAALHRPSRVDWAARFGLAPTEPLPAVAFPLNRGAQPPAPAALRHGSAAPRASCRACGAWVSTRVVEYCEANRSRFRGEILCINCQRAFGSGSVA